MCPFCRKIRIVLREKCLVADLVEVQPWDHPDELLRLNPASEAPVLIDGEQVVCDSQAITDHLEEAYPETPLLGRGAAQRAETRRLVAWFDTKFNREVTELLWRERMVKRWAKRGFSRSEVMREGAQNIRFHLTYIDYLYQQRKWLAGDGHDPGRHHRGRAPLGARLYGRRALGGGPGARDWYAKMKSRPSLRPVLMDRLVGLKPPAHYDDPDF